MICLGTEDTINNMSRTDGKNNEERVKNINRRKFYEQITDYCHGLNRGMVLKNSFKISISMYTDRLMFRCRSFRIWKTANTCLLFYFIFSQHKDSFIVCCLHSALVVQRKKKAYRSTVPVPVLTFEKFWFRFRFWFQLLKSYGSGSGSYF
jgi:hypothetical protein